jgi:phosphoesterase RecJ-like protein
MSEPAYEEAARILVEGRRFLVTGHRNPDGDALGSALALALALEDAGKKVQVVMRDGWPATYRILPGIERVTISDELPADWPGGWDAIVCMECPESARTGYPEMLSGTVLNIDHHPGNTRYGAVNLVDLPAAAVGEIVADLLDRLDWPITPAIATNLWVSLVSDTGSFKYGNTTPKCLALGARLVALGARPAEVNEELFEAAPVSSVRLESLVLSTLALHDGGRVATLELPARFYAESGAKETDTEGLVNRARGIEGVRTAALLKEAPDGVVRCSLRSKGTADVRSIAAGFGGGGHRNAAGCSLPGPLARARAAIVPLLAAAAGAEARS